MTQFPDTIRLEATTVGPTAVGLGTTSLVDIGISLHHTYGVPFLPGSSLKGLGRKAANDFELNNDEIGVLFGGMDDNGQEDNSSRGYVTFWDGWLDPEAVSVIVPDVITVHHPKYYDSQGATPPTDFDDPNPVAFLSIPAGTRFHLALSAPGAHDWLPAAVSILTHGLATLGLGARTAVGYGRFSVSDLPPDSGLDG